MKKHLPLLTTLYLLLTTTTTLANFSDVSYIHPYKAAIDYAQSEQILDGYSDGTFKPNQSINRAELVKIIINSTVPTEEISGKNCFPDVHTEWFAPFICTAKSKGIISGYPDGTFKPEKEISFVETAKIVATSFNYEIEPNKITWHKPYVIALSSREAIPVTVDSFEHKITRGELAEMIYKIKIQPSSPTYTYVTYNRPQKFNPYRFWSGYQYKDDTIKCVNFEIPGVDHETFKIIGNGFAIDKDEVYYCSSSTEYPTNKVLYSADNKTFEVIEFAWAKDKDSFFYETIEFQADPQTFEVLNPLWAKDKSNIYYKGRKDSRFDHDTFESLNLRCGKDKNNIYCAKNQNGDYILETITALDPKSTIALGKFFLKDNQQIVIYNEILEEADATTFELIDDPYAKDATNVYVLNNKIPNADPNSFEVLSNFHRFSKDKNQVFDLDIPIRNITSPQTFEFLKYDSLYQTSYGKDKDQAYFIPSSINTETDLSGSKYLPAIPIPNSDPETFEGFFCNYARDKNNMYYKSTPFTLDAPDLTTIKYAGQTGDCDMFFKDENSVFTSYWENGQRKHAKIEGADPDTFHSLPWGFSTDDIHVFYKEQLIEGADPWSIEVFDKKNARDKNRHYSFEK